MILVAGGTGRLGTLVVQDLLTDGQAVRVLTRDPVRAAHLDGAEVVVGDVRRPSDLPAAVRGVDTVVSAVHGFAGPGRVTPQSVDRDGNANLITATRDKGAHVVLLSVLGASPDHPIELFRMKAAAEHQLRASGLPWTIVRAGAFLKLYRDLLCGTAGRAGRPLVFGRGANPITFAAVADVATAVRTAVTAPAARGAVTEVAGPTLTFDELAAGLADELGPGARSPRHVPRALLRVLAATRAGTPARQAAAALVMDSHPFAHAPAPTKPQV